MDNLETNPAPMTSSSGSDLQDQVENLQKMVIYILVLTTVVAGAFAFFMQRQVKLTRAELDVLRPQAEQIDAQYQKLVGPDMEVFGRKLAEYGATHPDFAPIMTKYGLGKAVAPTGTAPVRPTAPATISQPPAKK
jgi:hypothetical protein